MMDVPAADVVSCIEGVALWLAEHKREHDHDSVEVVDVVEVPVQNVETQEIVIPLPESWRGERIEARVMDGVLVVRLLKSRTAVAEA